MKTRVAIDHAYIHVHFCVHETHTVMYSVEELVMHFSQGELHYQYACTCTYVYIVCVWHENLKVMYVTYFLEEKSIQLLFCFCVCVCVCVRTAGGQ